VLLLRTGAPRPISVRLWSSGFFVSAIAAFVGGTYHGFKPALEDSSLRSLWNITIYSIGASGAFMVSGVLTSSIGRHHKSTRWLLLGVIVTLAGFAIQQTNIQLTDNFNHNDIYHVMQIGALYLFFRGARYSHFSPR
jgi:MFS family permease